MKMKALVAGLMLAAASLSASADVIYRADAIAVTSPSYAFTDVKIGSITITSLSDLTGFVFAAESVNFPAPWTGTYTLDSVTFTSASLGSVSGDLDAAPGAFSYHNLAAGVYDIYASGVLSQDGQFHNAAFLGADYTVTAVPEPATYGMLLGGLGLVGALVSRRKKTA